SCDNSSSRSGRSGNLEKNDSSRLHGAKTCSTLGVCRGRPRNKAEGRCTFDRRPRQGQTRREAGTQSYGLLTVPRGGRIRLPGCRRDGRDPKVCLADRVSIREPDFFFPQQNWAPATGPSDRALCRGIPVTIKG